MTSSEIGIGTVDQKEAKIEKLKSLRSGVFSAVLKASGLESMADLTKKLGLKHQATLSNIQNGLRSASPKLIKQIEQLAPGVRDLHYLAKSALDSLVEPTSEAPPTIGERLNQDHRDQLEALQEARKKYQNIEKIRRNFDALSRNDVFVYISARTPPLEMKEEEDKSKLKEAIARAIQRQAFLLYLVPTDNNKVKDFTNYDALFESFKDDIRRIVGKTISDESIRDECIERLLLIQTDEIYFFGLPNFKWELFYSDTIDVSYKAKAGVLAAAGPVDEGGEVVGIPTPLPPHETKALLFEVARTVYLANLREPDRVPSEIAERLKESAEFATGKKIDLSD